MHVWLGILGWWVNRFVFVLHTACGLCLLHGIAESIHQVPCMVLCVRARVCVWVLEGVVVPSDVCFDV